MEPRWSSRDGGRFALAIDRASPDETHATVVCPLGPLSPSEGTRAARSAGSWSEIVSNF
jgi:hypothetical protein